MRAIKLKDNNFWDSTGIVHNKKKLSDKLSNIDKITDGAYLCGFTNTNTLTITTVNSYGIIIIIGHNNASIVQLIGPNATPVITDIVGGHTYKASVVENNVLTITELYEWDHYVALGSNNILNIVHA